MSSFSLARLQNIACRKSSNVRAQFPSKVVANLPSEFHKHSSIRLKISFFCFSSVYKLSQLDFVITICT